MRSRIAPENGGSSGNKDVIFDHRIEATSLNQLLHCKVIYTMTFYQAKERSVMMLLAACPSTLGVRRNETATSANVSDVQIALVQQTNSQNTCDPRVEGPAYIVLT